MKQISFTIQENEFQIFMEFLKNLSSVKNLYSKDIKFEDDKIFPGMSINDIIERVSLADEEIKNGDTVLHDEFVKQFKKWQ
jgi:hypothetical protein